MESLFTPIIARGLTTLKVQHDWKTDKVAMLAAKEWDPNMDFSQYNKTFITDTILTDDAVYLNTKQVWALYEEFGLKDYLQKVIDLMAEGKHFGIECYYYDKYDIHFISNQHSRKLGVHNKRRVLCDGGIRRHLPDEPEIEVLIDGLNLGRAMSFKNVAAGVQYGGAKSVVQMGEIDSSNMEQVGFFAYCTDKAKVMGVPDMRFPKEITKIVNDEKYSNAWVAGPGTKLGASGIPTAVGIYHAIKVATDYKLGSESLDGVSIAVQGLGQVGAKVVECLLQENPKLYIADVDTELLEKTKADYPDKDITIVPPEDIMFLECDVFCPCAMGGIIGDEEIPKLKCKIILGSANNQLKASSQEEEIRIAKLLKDAGILFQVDWWLNFGGVPIGIDEYELGDDADYDRMEQGVIDRVRKIAMKKYREADEKGITPTEAAYRECEEIIYGDKEKLEY